MEYLQKFTERLEATGASKITIKNYLADVRKFIRFIEETYSRPFQLSDFTGDMIKAYKASLQSAQTSINSQERYVSSLRKFATFLHEEHKLPFNPFTAAQEQKTNTDTWALTPFKQDLFLRKASELTVKNYILDIKQFVSWVENVDQNISKDTPFSSITTETIEEYKTRLVEDMDLSPLSVNRKLSSIRSYVNFLLKSDRLKAQPLILNTDNQHDQNISENNISQIHSFDRVAPVQTAPEVKAIQPEQEGEPASSSYSSFAPLRLSQKVHKLLKIAFDMMLTLPIIAMIEKASLIIRKSQGAKGLFEDVVATGTTQTGKTFLSTLTGIKKLTNTHGTPAALHEFIVSDPRKLFKGKIANLSKAFYAPLSISTENMPRHKKILHHLRYTRPDWYKRYHSYPIAHYLNFAILMIFITIIGTSMYSVFFDGGSKSPTLAAYTPNVAPPRILSFQGRLTDSSDNPITAVKNVRFAIYDSTSASGSGHLLWQELQQVTPDADGVFSVLMGNTGSSCGSPLTVATGACAIPSTLFTQNSTLFLGITIENDTELSPRQQVASVAYATNSETLQGLSPISGTNNTNVVLALDSAGNLTIGGSATPTFQASGGQFTLSGTVLNLTTTAGSNSNVQVNPDGSGKIDLQKAVINSSLNGPLTTAAGAVQIDDLFAVNATSSGQSAFTLNQDSTGPLISASASGIAKFTVSNSGGGYFAGSVGIGSTTPGATLDVVGSLRASGAITFSTFSNNGGLLYTNGSGAVAQTLVGSSGQCLQSIGGGTPAWGACGSAAQWTIGSGVIYPINNTLDFLLGGTATSSAKIGLININSGNPTATFSGNFSVSSPTGSAPTVTQNVLNGGTLNFQTSVGGDAGLSSRLFIANGGNIGIGTTSPAAALDVKASSGRIIQALGGANSLYISETSSGAYGISNSASGTHFIAASSNRTYLPQGEVNIGSSSITGVAHFTVIGTNAGFKTSVIREAASQTADIFQLQTSAASALFAVGAAGNITSTGGNNGGNALAIFNQTGAATNDILTGSASGTTNFVFNNSGNLGIGSTSPAYKLDISGGSGIVGQFSGRVVGGSAVNSNEFVTLSQLTGGTGQYWQLNSGALSPFSSTADVLIGATATASAKFGLINVAGGTPTATISGNLSLAVPTGSNPAATFNVLNGGSLNFQTALTGQGDGGLASRLFIKNDGNIGIGISNPAQKLDVNGVDSVLKVGLSTGYQSGYIGLSQRLNYAHVLFARNMTGTSGSDNYITPGAGAFGYSGIEQQVFGDIAFYAQSDTTTTNGVVSPASRLTIKGATGNIGIGSTAPTNKFQVVGTTTGNALVSFVQNTAADIFTASAGATTKFVINNAGNVGIGTTTAAALDVTGNQIIRGTNFDATVATSALDVNGAFIRIGDPTSAQTLTNGIGIKFNDTGAAHASIKYTSSTGRMDFCRSTSVSSLTCDTGAETLSLLLGSGNVGVGTTAPIALLDVNGTASASGSLTFRAGASSIQSTTNSPLTIGGNTTGNIILAPFNATAGGAVTPGANNVTDLGTSALQWRNIYAAGQICFAGGTDCTSSFSSLGVNYWNIAVGTLQPKNTTLDLLLGGTATTSAKFGFINVNSGTPTASISANTTNNATYLTGDGKLATVDGANLTLGDSVSTRDVILNPSGNIGIGSTAPTQKLDVVGNITASGTTGLNLTGTGSGITFATGTGTHTISASAGTLQLGAATLTGTVTGGNQNISSIGNITANTSGNTITGFGTVGTSGTTAFTGSTLALTGAATGATSYNGLVITANTGVITSGTWNGSIIGSLYGGTGANLSAAAQGAVPYFSATGVMSALAPSTAGFVLTTNGASANPSWVDIASLSSNYWTIGSGAIEPKNATLDLLIGGNSTSSAKFGFINVAGGTPTATISGNFGLQVPTGSNPAISANILNGGSLALKTSVGGDAGLTTQFTLFNSGNIALGSTVESNTRLMSYNTRAGLAGYFIQNSSAAGDWGLSVCQNFGGCYGAGDRGAIYLSTNGGYGIYEAPNGNGKNYFGSNVGIGSTLPTALLDVAGNASTSGSLAFTGSNKSINVLNGSSINLQTSVGGDGGLTSRLTVLNNGNVGVGTTVPGGFFSVGTSSQFTISNAGIVTAGTWNGTAIGAQYGGTGINTSASTGVPSISSGTWSVASTLATTLGGLGANVSAAGAGELLYSTSSSAYNHLAAGTSGQVLLSGGTGAPSWTNPNSSTFGLWDLLTGGVLTPKNATTDLLLGGTSSSSARIAFLNIAGGNPTASLSGNLAISSPTGSAPATGFLALNGGSLNFKTSVGGDAGATTRFSIANNGTLTASKFTLNGGLLYTDASGVFNQTTVGGSGQCLQSVGGGTPTWGSCGGINYWTSTNGALYPTNSTLDLLIGGTATSAAKFAFTNVNSGTPTFKAYNSSSTQYVSINHDGTNANITASTGTINIGAGGGTLYLNTDIVNDSTNFAGFVKISDKLLVQAAAGTNGNALAIFDNTSPGDILTASAAGVTKFVIDGSGNVGIGTTLPTNKFVAYLGNNQIAQFNDTSNPSAIWGQNLGFISQSSQAQIAGSGTSPLVFLTGATRNSMTAGTERMRLDTNGNLGIGTTIPLGLLNVNGSTSTAQGQPLVLLNQTGTADILSASTSGTTKFKLTNGGSVYAADFYDINSPANGLYFLDPAGSLISASISAELKTDYGGISLGDPNIGIGTTITTYAGAGKGNFFSSVGNLITSMGGVGRGENFLRYSEQLDKSATVETNALPWVIGSGTFTVAANDTGACSSGIDCSPDGKGSVVRLTGNTGTNTIFQTYNSTTTEIGGNPWTFSVWLKNGTATGMVYISITDGFTTVYNGINMSDTSSNRWNRYFVTMPTPNGSATGIRVMINLNGNNGNSVYAWGAQLEKQGSVGTYVRTSDQRETTTLRGLVAGATGTSGPSVIMSGNEGIATPSASTLLLAGNGGIYNGGTNNKNILELYNNVNNAAGSLTNNSAGIGFLFNRPGLNGATNIVSQMASISAVLTNATGNAYAGALTFATANTGAPIERMRIDAAGNVGINTTGGTNKLDVLGGAAFGTYGGVSAAPSNGLIVSGNTGIGTTTGTNKLDVAGGVAFGSYAGVNAAPSNGLIVSGNIGIATTGPDELLQVNGSSAGDGAHIGNVYTGVWDGGTSYAVFTHNTLKATTGSYALLQDSVGNTFLNAASTHPIAFRIANADKMTLDSGGNLGINTTTPNGKLHIYSDNTPSISGTVPTGAEIIQSSATTAMTIGVESASPFYGWIQMRHGNTTNIAYPLNLNPLGGNVAIGTTTVPVSTFSVDAKSTGTGIGGTSGTGAIRVAYSSGYGVGIDTWDSGTPRWGILNYNTNTPKVMMEGNYSSNDTFFYASSGAGNVGIGTTSTVAKLTIVGTAQNTLSLDSPAYPELTFRVSGTVKSYFAQVTTAGGYMTNSTVGDTIIRNDATAAIRLGHSSTADVSIDSNGNVGFGTTSPHRKFAAVNSLNGGTPHAFVNGDTTDNAGSGVLALATGATSTTTNVRFIKFFAQCNNDDTFTCTDNGSNGVGNIHLNNNAVAFDTSGTADFGEYMHLGEPVEAGDIMSESNNKAVKATKGSSLLGVISRTTDFLGNSKIKDEANTDVVGYVGQILTKVSTVNGPIHRGDRITSSNIPGIGQKATTAGQIVGVALEDLDNTNTITCPAGTDNSVVCGKVTLYVNSTWYDPDVYITNSGDLNISGSNGTYTASNQGSLSSRIGIFASAAIAQLKAGMITVSELTASALNVTGTLTTQSLAIASSNITIAGQSINDFINARVNSLLDNRLSSLTSPLASSSATVTAGRVIIKSPVATSLPVLDVTGNASISGTLATNGLSANTASISGLTANNLSASEATISGTLHATNIIADNITSLSAQIATLSATTIVNNFNTTIATMSGQQASSSADFLASLYANGIQTNFMNVASLSATSGFVPTLNSDFVTVNQGLIALGPTSLTDTSIAGTLSVNGNLILSDSSINVLGADLQIQPLRQGGVSFEGGQIAFDTDGNMRVSGNANFTKNVTVGGTLATNYISALPGSDVTVQLQPNHDFIIANASGSASFRVNNLGDVVASGSASFRELLANGLNIVRGAQADDSITETTASGSAGTAVINAYQTERTINTPYVSEKSLIYITATSDTQGVTPYVSRQTAEDPQGLLGSGPTHGSFTIEIPHNISGDIKLNWWIVN